MNEKKRLTIGFEVSGVWPPKEVTIPIFHMLVTGQTQMSGKTTTLKALATQAAEMGYKVLIFDTKTNAAEFTNFGEEIPVPLRQTTDSLTLLGLLESIRRAKLAPQFATVTRVTENAKTFEDVLRNAINLEESAKPGFQKDAARVIVDLMTRLINQTKDRKTSQNLELQHSINRISINSFPLEAQQMVVKTALEDALKIPNIIVILDESSKFLPQKWSSACQVAATLFVTQGAITHCFLWMGTQFLATTSKDAMKAMDVKLLGRQSHVTECEHTVDLIPKVGEEKYTDDTIMQLKLGHFVAVADNEVKLVYICPLDADQNQCREVAAGKRDPLTVQYIIKGIPVDAEEVEKARAKAKKEKTADKKKDENIIAIKKPPPEFEVITIELPVTQEDKGKFRLRPPFSGSVMPPPERMELMESNIEALRLRIKALEDNKTENGKAAPVQGTLVENTTVINLERRTRSIMANDDTDRGKILTLAKEGKFVKYMPLREVVQLLEEHHWTVNRNSIRMRLMELSNEGLLSVKQENKENMYVIAPNIRFTESQKNE